ncbi:hypothetical protein NDU88_004679 [Pleurodeles waltl]|uniref:Programmed cell death 7 n=1 Tax=Pleurodeles waltl TaxID=8319 RepID=A0AAV7TT91_PLEWA|nr:hypothetical protein NDU88_004679 [Pleurodeles waltl]
MERPSPPVGRVQWPSYQAQEPSSQAHGHHPQPIHPHGPYQHAQVHSAPPQQGLGHLGYKPQPQIPCFQQSQTKAPQCQQTEVGAFQQSQPMVSSFQQSLFRGSSHQQFQVVSKDQGYSLQQQTHGSPFQQSNAQKGLHQHQQQWGSTFQQAQPQCPPHSQSQRSSYGQFLRPHYQQALGPSYSEQQLQDPHFQHRYKEMSFPRQEPSSCSLQSQSLEHTNQFQSGSLLKEQPSVTTFEGRPKQEPQRPTDLKQPEQPTFQQVQRHGGPYQQTRPSALHTPLHTQDQCGLAPFVHQSFNSNESLDNRVPPFPTSRSLGNPPEHIHHVGSVLQNIRVDSDSKGAVSHTMFQGSNFLERPQYSLALLSTPAAAQSRVSSDPVHQQGPERTASTGPAMPLGGEPLVSHQVGTQQISYSPSLQSVNVHRHDTSPSLPLSVIQSQGNCQVPNADRAHVLGHTSYTHSNSVPRKDPPSFTHLDRVPFQGHPAHPNQSDTLFTGVNSLPVQNSNSFSYSNESHMQGITQCPKPNSAQIEGNIQLPRSDKLQMQNLPQVIAQDAAHPQAIPSLPGLQRIPVQNEESLVQGCHPSAHGVRASIQSNSSVPYQEKSALQTNQQFTHVDRPPVQTSQQFPFSDSIPTTYGPPSLPPDLQSVKDYQLQYANKPPPQDDQCFSHPGMAQLQFLNRLPQPDRPEVQAEHPFPPCTVPRQWHLNAEHFQNVGSPLVCGGETPQLFPTKGVNNGFASQQEGESIQRKQDELWISRFLANRRQTLQHLTKSAGSPSIAEARELLYGAQKLVWELRTVCQLLQENAENEDVWSEVYLQAVNIHKELQDKMKALNRPGYIEGVKKKLEKIRKRRLRIQREKHETPAKKEEAARAAEREAKIDKWRMKCIHEVHEKKREREVKAAADSVLSEVLKKQGDTKRMISVLRALEKLRKLRKEAAARKGVSPPVSADDTFENHIKRLRLLIKERTELYDAEERALRVMLEGEQEKERKIEREKKQKKERDKLLQQQHEINCILFGEPEELPPDHPLLPFRQYYLQAEHSVPSLIQIRNEWDQYLVPADHPGGTCIPPGWVLPSLPTSDAWAAAVGQTD